MDSPPSRVCGDADRVLAVSRFVWEHVVSAGWLDGPRDPQGNPKAHPDYGRRGVDLFRAAEAMFPLVALACSRVLAPAPTCLLRFRSPGSDDNYGTLGAITGASCVPAPSCVAWIVNNRHISCSCSLTPQPDKIICNAVGMEFSAHCVSVAVKEVVATLLGLCMGGHISQAQSVLGKFPALWDGRTIPSWACGDDGSDVNSVMISRLKAIVKERVIENVRGASGSYPTFLARVCGSGHLDVVKWLISVAGITNEEAPWLLNDSLRWSLIRGKMEVFKFLFDDLCCRNLRASALSDAYRWCAIGLAPSNIKWCMENFSEQPEMENMVSDVLCNKHSTLEDCLWMEKDLHTNGLFLLQLSSIHKVDVAKWVLTVLPSTPGEKILNCLGGSMGDVGFVEWLMTEKGFTPTSSMFKAACSTSRKKGSTLAKWLSTRVSLSQSDFTKALLSALRWSNMEVAEWLEGTFHVMDAVNSNPEVAGITLVDLCRKRDDRKGKGLQWFLHHLSQPSKIDVAHIWHAISESIECQRRNYIHMFLENFPALALYPLSYQNQRLLTEVVKELFCEFDVKALELLISGRSTSRLFTPEFVSECLTSDPLQPQSSKAVKWAIRKFNLQYSHIKAKKQRLLFHLFSKGKNECARWLLSTFDIPFSDFLQVLSCQPDLAGLQVILDHYGSEIDAAVIRKHFMFMVSTSPHLAIYTINRGRLQLWLCRCRWNSDYSYQLHADKLIGWTTDTSAFVNGFISSIVEAASSGGRSRKIYFANGLHHSKEKMSHSFYWRKGGCTHPIDITEMDASTARRMCSLLTTTEKTDPINEARETISATALRTWVQARNWSAVDEIILADTLKEKRVNLSQLGLDSVPERLRGLSCKTLDLSRNNIAELPEWLIHSPRLSDVILVENPLREPLRSHSEKWVALKSAAIFPESTVLSRRYKLILIGESAPAAEALQKCLVNNKNKAKVASYAAFSSTQVLTHEYLKIPKRSEDLWTVWELGGTIKDFYLGPFYPCFFCSHSVFMFVLDLEAQTCLPRLKFWLHEISLCQKQASMHAKSSHGRANVIIVGSFTDSTSPEKASSKLQNLLADFSSQPEWRNLNFRAIFGINFQSGQGFQSHENPEHTIETTVRAERPVESIANLLHDIANQESMPVPKSWLDLSTVICKQKGYSLRWAEFVALAKRCGLGKNHTDKQKQWQEIQICCDYLSDIGTLIHFRHKYFGFDSSLVVVHPDFFLNLLKEIPGAVGNMEYPFQEFYHRSTGAHIEAAKEIRCSKGFPLDAALLEKLEILIGSQLSFFFLPTGIPTQDCNQEELASFWRVPPTTEGTKSVFNGREIKFTFLLNKEFSRVMASLCNLPEITPLLFWRDGILISSTRSAEYDPKRVSQRLVMTHTDDGEHTTTIDICMHTIFKQEEGPQQLSWSHNLMSTVLDVLLWNRAPTIQSEMIPCPHCLLSSAQSCPTPIQFTAPALPPRMKNFTRAEVVERLLGSGREHLTCKRDGTTSVSVWDCAPDLLDRGYSVFLDANDIIFTSPSEMTTKSTTRRTEAEEPTTMAKWRGHLVRVVKGMRDVNCARKAHISSIPEHPKVAKFIGLFLDKERDSVGKVMECSIPRVPTHLEEALGAESMIRLNNTPFLGPLLKICIQKGNGLLLDQVLSMTLREKILKDIAHGLCHLHGLVPPVIANLDIGNVLVISLDESQPGPFVKIGDYICTQTERNSTRPCWSPEEAAEGTSLLNTQTDVWRFGVLTHRLVYPLESSVELQINLHPPPGDSSSKFGTSFHHIHSTMHHHPAPHSPNNGPRPRTQRVKLRQLGTALSILQRPPGSTTTITPTNTQHQHQHQQHHAQPQQFISGFFPLSSTTTTTPTPRCCWAQQLMTCCWMPDPSHRPSIHNLLDIWNYL
ncbi:hypothetical protein Pelo_11674 [Pelomyxa schiedti]|nr:hypothetical protein Pelo_11674 [Pelomyxa schiedti]